MANFTERQRELIAYCSTAQDGGGRFTRNILTQGWCSPKQEEVLAKIASEAQLRSTRSYKSGPTKQDTLDYLDVDELQDFTGSTANGADLFY